ncbi:MAG: OPT/YSL family transporter [Phycisphaerales bacterium]|nr:OPT/YSL family transporter [Phycisphaerales bacterium]
MSAPQPQPSKQLLHLSEEQIRTWTLEQKDRWWLENVYKGDMPQLTLRSALTGFFLGGILSATNLYVGAKSGWTLGVGITSVILAFSMFKILSRMGVKEMTLLENNCMQSVATAAGYMTGPLTSGLAAYMMVQNELLNMWHIFWFMIVLSLLGVLVAFPLKRRFINDEQGPFPEGRACGVVLHTLYTSEAAVGIFKAKVLALCALAAGGITFISGEHLMKLVQVKWLRLQEVVFQLPHDMLDWGYNQMVSWGWIPAPVIGKVDIRSIGVAPELDLAMVGAGGLMGIKAASSMLIGMVLNFVVVVPWMIQIGEIQPKPDGTFNRVHVLNTWALWWGIAIMVTAALMSLFAKPDLLISAFTGVFKKRKPGSDILAHIELPFWISAVGVPIIGGIGVWMAHDWFGVHYSFGAMAVVMVIFLTLIAASSTSLTGITPTGSLSKIPQFTFGALDPKHAPTNLMSGVMCIEVASNASNLLMDIKPGYMLGAKPRQQAIGHCIGIFAGAMAATPLFFLLFLSDYQPGKDIQEMLVTEDFGFPSALQWKGVSDLVTSVFDSNKALIRQSAVISMGIAAAVGVVFELWRIFSKGRFPLSPLAIGLGVVITPGSTMAMFAGALLFWAMHRIYAKREGSTGKRFWVDTHEPICAGIIAGAAIIGICNMLTKAFLL